MSPASKRLNVEHGNRDPHCSARAELACLVLSGMSLGEIGAVLPIDSVIAEVYASCRADIERMISMVAMARVNHTSPADPETIGHMFDRAVMEAPDASVAAYSLGDADILAKATEEIVTWLQRQGFVHAHADVLDFGCGTGRVAACLSKSVASVVGLDVSSNMIRVAQMRHGSIENLRFEHTDGRLPADLQPRSFDLVIAADSFPYLVQSDIALEVASGLADLIRSEGYLVILNLSYSDDAHSLAREIEAKSGLVLLVNGSRPFSLWDGSAYVFSKPA